MKHLTVEEMISFVSIKSLDEKSLELIDRVSEHICECSECRKKVDAFQTVQDELDRMENAKKYKNSLAQRTKDEAAEKRKNTIIRKYTDEYINRNVAAGKSPDDYIELEYEDPKKNKKR